MYTPEQRTAAIATIKTVIERELWENNTDAYHGRLRAAWAILQEEIARPQPDYTRLSALCVEQQALHAELRALQSPYVTDTEGDIRRVQSTIVAKDAEMLAEMDRIGV